MENQIIISVLLCLIVILVIYKDYKKVKLRDKSFKNFKEIFSVFETTKEINYNKLFREEIAVFTSSGFKYNKEELGNITKKYVKSVIISCGEEIINDLIRIYGDIEPIALSVAHEFVEKVLQDELSITTSVQNNINQDG